MSGIDKQKKLACAWSRAEDIKEAENVFMKLSSVSKEISRHEYRLSWRNFGWWQCDKVSKKTGTILYE